MDKLEYNFKSKLEHHAKFSFKFRLIVSTLWIFNVIWAITILYKIPMSILPTYHVFMVSAVMLWKNILIAIPLTLVSFGKFIKEDCDVNISISDTKIKVLYKSLKKFNYSSYPENVDVIVSYNIEDIIKTKKNKDCVVITSRSQEEIYDQDKNCLFSKKYFVNDDVIYIPEENIDEIYEKINELKQNLNN